MWLCAPHHCIMAGAPHTASAPKMIRSSFLFHYSNHQNVQHTRRASLSSPPPPPSASSTAAAEAGCFNPNGCKRIGASWSTLPILRSIHNGCFVVSADIPDAAAVALYGLLLMDLSSAHAPLSMATGTHPSLNLIPPQGCSMHWILQMNLN